jgi:hypothetical protein
VFATSLSTYLARDPAIHRHRKRHQLEKGRKARIDPSDPWGAAAVALVLSLMAASSAAVTATEQALAAPNQKWLHRADPIAAQTLAETSPAEVI